MSVALFLLAKQETISYTDAIVTFPDQIQIFLVLLGPQETSRDCVWDLFDPCHLRHFSDNLHIHHYILELCEKVPCSISGQDQKDYQKGCAIKKACLDLHQHSGTLVFTLQYTS